MIRVGTNSTPRRRAIASAIILALTSCAFTPGLASAASGASGPGYRSWPPRPDLVRAADASRIVGAHHMVLARLDEESVPAAENPGAPALDGSAPEINPGPATDWERVPAAGASPSSAALAPVAPANAASSTTAVAPAMTKPTVDAASSSTRRVPAADGDASAAANSGNRPANLAMKPAANAQAQPSVPAATVASVQPASASDANNGAGGPLTGGAGKHEADQGPPPALDLDAVQSGPDLSSIPLAGEIKKAETPARAATLRVTEQARADLAAGKTDDALRGLGRAVSIDPGNPFEYFYLGRAYIVRGNYTQALTFFKRAEIGFGARPDWLGETVGFEGACYEELGQTTDAALAYRRALGSAPGNLRARVGYSRLSGYLPSTATADASAAAAPANEALPPPEHTAAGPAPAEAPPPPPPAPDNAPKRISTDHQPD